MSTLYKQVAFSISQTVFTAANIQISLDPHSSERNLKVAAIHTFLKSPIYGYNEKKTL